MPARRYGGGKSLWQISGSKWRGQRFPLRHPKGESEVWKMPFSWMRRDEDLKPVVQGILRIQQGLREDTVIQRVITTQGLKPEETWKLVPRLSSEDER